MHHGHTSQQRRFASPSLRRWPGIRPGPVRAGLCVLGLLLWAAAGLALAHGPSSNPSSSRSSRPHPLAESLTQDLVALGTRHQLADPATQAQLLSDLLTVAAERQELLAALIEDDPGEVLRIAMPADLRASLPPAVQALVEAQSVASPPRPGSTAVWP